MLIKYACTTVIKVLIQSLNQFNFIPDGLNQSGIKGKLYTRLFFENIQKNIKWLK